MNTPSDSSFELVSGGARGVRAEKRHADPHKQKPISHQVGCSWRRKNETRMPTITRALLSIKKNEKLSNVMFVYGVGIKFKRPVATRRLEYQIASL